VALGDRYLHAVVFITGAWSDGNTTRSGLRGTGFVIGLPAADPNAVFLYVVTAAHVVRPCHTTAVRITKQDGSVEDRPVKRWAYHASEDVAVTPFHDPTGQFAHSFVETGQFVGQATVERPPAPGDDVYFAGLLGMVPSMGAGNVPMLRAGAIGALGQIGIPMRLPDNTVIHVAGHLIDCRSFGGFSGSPCFVRYVSGTGTTPRIGLPYPVESTLLLGMVAGHFDLKASVELPDQEDRLKIPVAAGIAVLSTSETIMETLEEDEALVTERNNENENYRRRAIEEEGDAAATADLTVEDRGEFERFEDVLSKLAQVPKSELDEKLKES
jgi:hypothetical protein